LKDFIVRIEAGENIEVVNVEVKNENNKTKKINIIDINERSWRINGIGDEEEKRGE
jgi:hypothetical protein